LLAIRLEAAMIGRGRWRDGAAEDVEIVDYR
jgi:hypothetical protein